MNMKFSNSDSFAHIRVANRHEAIKQLMDSANSVVYAVYTPGGTERQLSTSPINQPITLRLVQNGDDFNVVFNADALGRDKLSLSEIANMGGKDALGGRLLVLGAGSLSNFLRGIQHINNIVPDLGLKLSVKLLSRNPELRMASAPQVLSTLEEYTSEKSKLAGHAPQKDFIGSPFKLK